jgi:hypothetical protein
MPCNVVCMYIILFIFLCLLNHLSDHDQRSKRWAKENRPWDPEGPKGRVFDTTVLTQRTSQVPQQFLPSPSFSFNFFQ